MQWNCACGFNNSKACLTAAVGNSGFLNYYPCNNLELLSVVFMFWIAVLKKCTSAISAGVHFCLPASPTSHCSLKKLFRINYWCLLFTINCSLA